MTSTPTDTVRDFYGKLADATPAGAPAITPQPKGTLP